MKNYFKEAENGKLWCYDCKHYYEEYFCGYNAPKCDIYGDFTRLDNPRHPDTAADTCEHYRQKDGERWFERAEKEDQEMRFVNNFCDLIANTELYLPEGIGESVEEMAKKLFKNGWRISRNGEDDEDEDENE